MRHTLVSLSISLLVISALSGVDASATLWNSQCRATTGATLTEIGLVFMGTMTEMYTDVRYHFVTEDTEEHKANAEWQDKLLSESEEKLTNATDTISELTAALTAKEKDHTEAIETKAKEHKANAELQDKLLSESKEKLTNATDKISKLTAALAGTQADLEAKKEAHAKAIAMTKTVNTENTELRRKLQQQKEASIDLEKKLKDVLRTHQSDISFAPGVDLASLFTMAMATVSPRPGTPGGNPDEPKNNMQDHQNLGNQVTQTVNGPHCSANADAKATCAPCPPPTDQYTGPWMSNLNPWMQHFRTAITVVSKFIWYTVSLAVSLAVMTIIAIVRAFMKCLPWISSIIFPCRNCVLLEQKTRECEDLQEQIQLLQAVNSVFM
jgi:hypothetical protein